MGPGIGVLNLISPYTQQAAQRRAFYHTVSSNLAYHSLQAIRLHKILSLTTLGGRLSSSFILSYELFELIYPPGVYIR